MTSSVSRAVELVTTPTQPRAFHDIMLLEPIEHKRRPKQSNDAKFIISFTSSVAMVYGDVALKHFTDEALQDSTVLAMADRVTYREEEDASGQFCGDSSTSRPTVEIRTRDGRLLQCRPDGMPGDPRNPVSTQRLEAKFRDCVSFAAKPVRKANVERAIGLIRKLDTLDDAAEIVRVLSE